MYGKELYLKEEHAIEDRRRSVDKDHQFNFSQKHKPTFERLIPRDDCEKVRKAIKKHLEASAKDMGDKKNKCCCCCECCNCCDCC